MRELLLVAIGGAVGSVARVLTGGLVYRFVSPAFPWGTATVNVVGCALFGVAVGVGMTRGGLSTDTRALVLSGLMGGFTTFSAFSFETVELVMQGFGWRALANVLGQVLVGGLALWTGMQLAGRP